MRARRTAPTARHGAFLARRIAARRHAREITPLERCLRRASLVVGGNRLHMSLMLAMYRSVRERMPSTERAGLPVQRAQHSTILRERHMRERVESRLHARVASVLLHRWAAAIGLTGAEFPVRMAPAAARRDVARLALTMAHPHAPADRSTTADRAVQPTGTPMQRSTVDARTLQTAAVSLPADELSRVTEHVLRTLDRRALSWRERSGQA